VAEVITVWLNANPDPQRGEILPADFGPIAPLARSLQEHGRHLTVLSDCLPEGGYPHGASVVAARPGGNPYFHRWAVIADYLAEGGASQVWCVDAGDVEMLTDPGWLPDRLHIGSERSSVGSPWMRATNPGQGAWIAGNADLPLLNPGVVGGDSTTVQAFARAVTVFGTPDDLTDMGAANQAAYQLWPDHRTGHPVHTPYKADACTPGAWWKHK